MEYIIAVAVALFWGLAFFLGYLRGTRSQSALVAELTQSLQTQIDRVEQMQEQRQRLDQSVQGLATQRDEWRDQYYLQSVQHGNAQSMLYEELLRLRQQARRQGVTLRINPLVEAAVFDFEQQHASPTSKTRPDIKRRPLPKSEDYEPTTDQ